MKSDTKKEYRIIVERDEDGIFVASVPALPGCHTQAKTLPLLYKNIRDAVRLCLSVAKENPQYRAQIKELAFEPTFIALDTITV